MVRKDLVPHPLACIFPQMDEEQFADLVADLKANGLREPITVDSENRIIDGVNRYRACKEAGIEIRTETKDLGEGELINWIASRNLHRRHLKTPQRAAIAAEIASLKRAGDGQANLPVSQVAAAKLLGVSERSVRAAAAVKEVSPVLHDDIKAGTLSVHAAEQIAKLPDADREKAISLIKRGDIKGAKARTKPAKTSQHGKVASGSSGFKGHHVYAALFAELDALPTHLAAHSLAPAEAQKLIAELRNAIEKIESAIEVSP
jgi:ParB-like chromosome segregation protein Spo0J